jgi:hypothetical protein
MSTPRVASFARLRPVTAEHKEVRIGHRASPRFACRVRPPVGAQPAACQRLRNHAQGPLLGLTGAETTR